VLEKDAKKKRVREAAEMLKMLFFLVLKSRRKLIRYDNFLLSFFSFVDGQI